MKKLAAGLAVLFAVRGTIFAQQYGDNERDSPDLS
jgi:hypothetical protein